MLKRKLPKSVKKYVRKEKAKIRQKFSNTKEAEDKIKELMLKFFNNG